MPITPNIGSLASYFALDVNDLLRWPLVIWDRRILSRRHTNPITRTKIDQWASQGLLRLVGKWLQPNRYVLRSIGEILHLDKVLPEDSPLVKRANGQMIKVRASREPDWFTLSQRRDIDPIFRFQLDQLFMAVVPPASMRWRLSAKNMLYLSRRVNPEDILLYPKNPWFREGLSRNPRITPKVLLEIDPNYTVGVYDDRRLCRHLLLDREGIESLAGRRDIISCWRRSELSRNPTITMDLVRWFDKTQRTNPTTSYSSMRYFIVTGEWNWRWLSMRVPIEDITADLTRFEWDTQAIITRVNRHPEQREAVDRWFQAWWRYNENHPAILGWASRLRPITVLRHKDKIPWDLEALATHNRSLTIDDLYRLLAWPDRVRHGLLEATMKFTASWSDLVIVS